MLMIMAPVDVEAHLFLQSRHHQATCARLLKVIATSTPICLCCCMHTLRAQPFKTQCSTEWLMIAHQQYVQNLGCDDVIGNRLLRKRKHSDASKTMVKDTRSYHAGIEDVDTIIPVSSLCGTHKETVKLCNKHVDQTWL
jgi:hypothetical protein